MRTFAYVDFTATVQHTLIRGDGSRIAHAPDTRVIRRTVTFWHKVWDQVRAKVKYFAFMTFATFLLWVQANPHIGMQMLRYVSAYGPVAGIVTAAGIDYLATTFVSNSAPLINFNYHTYGTGDVHGSTTTVTNATATTPVVLTFSSNPFFQNDIVKISGITGITGVNGIWQINYISATQISLIGSIGGGSSFGGGTNAAQLLNGQADTAMTTEVASLTRVAGAQTNPAANQYQTVATVTFTGTSVPLTIIEWGLFSALSTGTLWDRRWMNTANAPSTTATAALTAAPITITQTTDSIQTTYVLTCSAGGS